MRKRYVDVILLFLILSIFLFTSFTSINPWGLCSTIDNEIDNNIFKKTIYINYGKNILLKSKEHNIEFQNIKFDTIEYNKRSSLDKLIQTGLSFGLMNSSWPMKCHDLHHTGLSPYNTTDNPYDELWKFRTEGWMNGGIIIGNNETLYFGNSNFYLYAVYPNGTEKWRYGSGMSIDTSPAIADDGTIYVGSWDDYLHAVYPNGTIIWKFDALDTIASSPAIGEDGTIYFGTMGPGNYGRVWAINPNGTEKWHYDTGFWITAGPAIGNDGTVYIGSGDQYFYTLYPNNGTLRWRFKTEDYIKGPPSIADDGTIYIGSWDGYLYSLYPNGTLKWKHGIGAGTESNPSIGPDGTIYVGGGYLYAIYRNGTRKWTFDFGEDRHSHRSSPAISADGIIYIGLIIGDDQGGEIVAVNPDGTERWRKWIADHEVQSSPAIGSDGTIYIGSSFFPSGNSYGYLYAFGRGDLEANANGPYMGIVGEPVQFTGTADGGYPPYSYHWDFGDEETSEEQNPTHEYDTIGNYTVILTVTDDNESVAVDTTWALIRESNDPPNKPTITGETQGYIGESYEYTFTTTDPDDDDIWFYIEWGDDTSTGWIGPYDSDEVVTKSHTWNEEGTYTIRAKAKDIFDEESDWGTLEVTMPVNQQISYEHPFLSRFLKQFPNALPIIKNLLDI